MSNDGLDHGLVRYKITTSLQDLKENEYPYPVAKCTPAINTASLTEFQKDGRNDDQGLNYTNIKREINSDANSAVIHLHHKYDS